MQALDDSTPEARSTYELELVSATGGATVDASANIARVTVVASDYPHGLFEFSRPQELVLLEDASEVATGASLLQRNLGMGIV